MHACPTMMAVMPVASSLPNRSLQLRAMRKHTHASAAYSASSTSRPTSPSSSPMMPVIMSVVCSGRNPNFCTELPSPTPNTRPEAMEMSDCVAW